ncbi:hypothetical protein SteCoe_6779 [Stentor coeruleus]|uniref:Sfi1 spindle body domain-containing protein n=1 Tax=Stentor coeruleus TaxID=5963 RepID=A0A1R2CP68_9CILI|nr:hypothetical protein SteCoe_6779 [Stentor coeruleus]
MQGTQGVRGSSTGIDRDKLFRPGVFNRERFQSSLTLLENDRNELLESLRDLEKKHEIEIEKNIELGRNLDFQSEHINQLEVENLTLAENLKIIQGKLIEFESINSSLMQERGTLRATISQFQDEMDSFKLKSGNQELFIEKLACSYNDEKDTILKVHKRHSQLLASKIWSNSLCILTNKKKNWAFNTIKSIIANKRIQSKLCLNFLFKHLQNNLSFAFCALYKNIRVYKKEIISRKLINKVFVLKTKKKIWGKLLDFAKIMKNYKKKVFQGVLKMHVAERTRRCIMLFSFLQQWKNIKIKDLYEIRVLKIIIIRKYKKYLEMYFKHWGKVHREIKNRQAKEDLATDLTIISFKQSIFYEFRRVIQLQKQKKQFYAKIQRLVAHKNKFRVLQSLIQIKSQNVFKLKRLSHISSHCYIKSLQIYYRNWVFKVKNSKKSKNLKNLFITKSVQSNKLITQKLFLAWKFHLLINKHKKTTNELAIEKPKREEYENAYKNLHAYNIEMLQKKAIVNILKEGKNVVKSYFFIWHSKIYEFQTGKRRIARLFVKVYGNTLECRFKQWVKYIRNNEMRALVNQNDETIQENTVLLEHISNLENCLNEIQKEKKFFVLLNMKKALNVISRKFEINNLRKWAYNALKCKNYIIGASVLNSVITNYFLSISLSSLNNYLYDKKQKLEHQMFNDLQNENYQVKCELEEACNNLTNLLDHKWKLEEYLKKSTTKKGLLSLNRGYTSTLSFCFKSWVKKIQLLAICQKMLNKSFNFYTKSYLRLAIKTWSAFKNFVNKKNHENNINALVVEKKIIRRDMNIMKNKLEGMISEKQTELYHYHIKNNQLNTLIEKFTNINFRKNNELIGMTKAQYVFSIWKNYFINKKGKFFSASQALIRGMIRFAFNSIFFKAKNVQEFIELQKNLMKMIISYKERKTKHALNWWKSNQFRVFEQFKDREIEFTNHKIQGLSIRYNNCKKQSLYKSSFYLSNRTKCRVFLSWKSAIKQLKAIKNSYQTFLNIAFKYKTQFALTTLYENKSINQRNNNIYDYIYNFRINSLVNCTFASWKNLHIKGKYLIKSLQKIINRYNRDYLNFSLGCLKRFATFREIFGSWEWFTKIKCIRILVSSHEKHHMSDHFKLWGRKAFYQTRIMKKVLKIISTTRERLEKYGIKVWKESVKIAQKIEDCEQFGNSAIKCEKLIKLVDVYNGFIQKEGLNNNNLKNYMMENLPINLFLMQQDNKKSHPIKPWFYSWRLFIVKKAKFRKTCNRMVIFKQKGNFLNSFNLWKRISRQYLITLKSTPRDSLLSTIQNMDKEISTLQISLKEKHINLIYVERYTEILEEHVRRGQNQALSNLAINMKKTMLHGLSRWFINVQAIRIYEIDYNLQDVEKELVYTRRKCKDYDIENKDLLIENKSLVKNSYESRELANVIRKLNLEKAKLEDEICEKKETIRRLVQENRELALELSLRN